MISRVARIAVFGVLALSGSGCYSYLPSGATPKPGSEVAVILTDKGRVALSQRVGPEIDQLRGRLMSSTDTSVTISMSESVTLRDVSAKWTDEVLTLHRDHFGSMRTKELSRGRTTAAAGAASAFALFFVVNGALGGGSEKAISDPSTPPTGTLPSSRVSSLSIPFWSDF